MEHGANKPSSIKLKFHDADADTDTGILARILADKSDTRDFLKLFLWQAERHTDILATILGEEIACVGRKDRSRVWRVGVGVRVRVGAVECQLNPADGVCSWNYQLISVDIVVCISGH